MSDETPESESLVPEVVPSDGPPYAVTPKWGPGSLAWSGNPQFTRKEAFAAKRKGGHPPMTPEIAQGIAAALMAGASPQEAAVQFGYAKSYAKRAVGAPGVQNRIKAQVSKLMDKAGMTLEDQIGKLKKLQDAEKVVTASKDGIITDEKAYPDNGIRARSVELGLELHGAFPHKRQYDTGDRGPKLIINVDPTFKNVFFGADVAAAMGDGAVEPSAEDAG